MNAEHIRAEFEKALWALNQIADLDPNSNVSNAIFIARVALESGQAALASQAKSVLPNQEPLGSEFEKVLFDNLDSLYETSVASQPTDDRLRELEKDAARYHWLRDNYHGFAHYRSGVIPCVDLGQDIDKQIAAMKEANK